jgi:hypothetical protein
MGKYPIIFSVVLSAILNTRYLKICFQWKVLISKTFGEYLGIAALFSIDLLQLT